MIEAKIIEYKEPQFGKAARISWHGWTGEHGTDKRLDVIHAWLIEDLDHSRVRVLTQESQKGKPALELARTLPNPMINGHQEWLNGLIHSAQTKLEL